MKYELMKPDDNGCGIEPRQLQMYKYLERKLRLKKALPQKNDGAEARVRQLKVISAVKKGFAAGLIGATVLSVAMMLITGELAWIVLLFIAIFIGCIGLFELEDIKKGLGAFDAQRSDQYEYMKKLIERDGIEKIYMDYKSADKLFSVSKAGKEYLFVKRNGFFDLDDVNQVDVYIRNGNQGRTVYFDAQVRLRKNTEYTYSLLGLHGTNLGEKKLMAKKDMIMSRQKRAGSGVIKKLPVKKQSRNGFGEDAHKVKLYEEIDKRFAISKRENMEMDTYERSEFNTEKNEMLETIEKDGIDSIYSDLLTAEKIADGKYLGNRYMFMDGRVFFELRKILKAEVEEAWETVGYRLLITVMFGEHRPIKKELLVINCWGRTREKLEEYTRLAEMIMDRQKKADTISALADLEDGELPDMWGDMHFTDTEGVNRIIDVEGLKAVRYDFDHRDKDIGDDSCFAGRLYVFIKGRTIIRIKDIVGVNIIKIPLYGDTQTMPDIWGRNLVKSELEDAEFIRIKTYVGDDTQIYDVCLMKDHEALVRFQQRIMERRSAMTQHSSLPATAAMVTERK